MSDYFASSMHIFITRRWKLLETFRIVNLAQLTIRNVFVYFSKSYVNPNRLNNVTLSNRTPYNKELKTILK